MEKHFGMIRISCFFVFFFTTYVTMVAQTRSVRFDTNHGSFEVELFDSTPRHRDLFLQAVREGVYTDALFNRVIENFVNQGGELDDFILNEEQTGVRPRKRLDHEIRAEHIHAKGTLGAGRDDNPDKASFLTQIYFVIGKVYTEEQLQSLEKKRGISIPTANRNTYQTIGGVPHLDGNYTIFGRVISGLDVVERINQVKTDVRDVPAEPVSFSVTVIE